MHGIISHQHRLWFSDSFTRPDSASIGNADTGQTWQALSGSWSISSNAAVVAVGGADRVMISDSCVGNGTIEHTLANSSWSTTFAGVVFRVTDVNNLLAFVINNANARIYKRSGGTWSQLGIGGSFAPVNGSDVTLRTELNDASISCYVNGVLKTSHTLSGGDLSAYGATKDKVGIHTYYSTTSHKSFFVRG